MKNKERRIYTRHKPFEGYRNATTGITLVALVVTIVVLLILAGITINLILGPNSIFNNAKEAKEQTEIAQAREKLEVVLNSAKIEKMTNSKYDLNKYISDNIQNVEINDSDNTIAVDGYIFKIDRNTLEIIEYIGPVNEIVITATVSGNDGWVTTGEAVKVSGTIKTYSGGTIIKATVKRGEGQETDLVLNGEEYEVSITEDTTVTISAEDSKGKKNSKTIDIIIKRDTTPPVLTSIDVIASGMKIKINAVAQDNESGLEDLTYSIVPETIKEGAKGNLTTGIETILTATEETEYTVTITAKDNSKNETVLTPPKVTTINGITVAEARKITSETIKDYMGVKVIDYTPTAGGTWRVFWCDEADAVNPNGYFGAGERTIYIKRDAEGEWVNLGEQITSSQTDGGEMLRKMHPKWSASEYSAINTTAEQIAEKIYTAKNWTKYVDSNKALFAVGSVPIEMFVKAYNKYFDSEIIDCGISNENGYGTGNKGGPYVLGANNIDIGEDRWSK